MFCPKCKSLLIPSREKGKKILKCSCGYKKDFEGETLQFKEKVDNKKIEIIDEDSDTPMAKVKAICDKCGNKEAYFWTIQTRASDEPETRFYKCTKCKHTWRETS